MRPAWTILLLPLALLLILSVPCFWKEACAHEKGGPQRVRIIFVGDVMAHRAQLEAARRGENWDFSPQFRRVAPLFRGALVIANLETVFAGEEIGYSDYPRFNTPDALAAALAGAGVKIVTLANNHILDQGGKGAERTRAALEKAGIAWAGLAGAADDGSLFMEYMGLRLAVLNFTRGSNRPPERGDRLSPNIISDEAVRSAIAAAKARKADMVAVCFHWGEEGASAPAKAERDLAALCLREGADMIIGTHPHVVQPVEIVPTGRGFGVVAWSLGNFVSAQRRPPRERSLALAVDVDMGVENGAFPRIVGVSVAPLRVSFTSRKDGLRCEVVYAGVSGRRGLGPPAADFNLTRAAGRNILNLLGLEGEPDTDGFYAFPLSGQGQ